MKPLIREWRLFYYRAALRQMGPTHPDAGYVVLQINQLESERV